MGLFGRPKKVDSKVGDILHYISQGDFEIVKRILNEFGINVQDADGRTTLVNSVIENQINLSKWLIDNGADLDIQDRGGYSALHFIALNQLSEMGEYILTKNPNLELRDNYGNTPLWTAVMNSRENLSVVKLLLDNGANINNVNNAGRTPKQMLETFYGNSFEQELKCT